MRARARGRSPDRHDSGRHELVPFPNEGTLRLRMNGWFGSGMAPPFVLEDRTLRRSTLPPGSSSSRLNSSSFSRAPGYAFRLNSGVRPLGNGYNGRHGRTTNFVGPWFKGVPSHLIAGCRPCPIPRLSGPVSADTSIPGLVIVVKEGQLLAMAD